MSGKWVAINASVFGVFFILFIHSWINILFLSNKFNSSDFLKNFLQEYNLTDNILPYTEILDFLLTNEACPENYEDFQIFYWPGFVEGLHLSEKVYEKSCHFTECFKRDYEFYSRRDCRNDNCCKYYLNTANDEECNEIVRSSQSLCKCPESIINKYIYKNNPAGRNVMKVKNIEGVSVNKIKNKFCYKKIKFEFSNNGKCDNNTLLCYENYCLKNHTECPNYSKFLDDFSDEINSKVSKPIKMKPIFELKAAFNSFLCTGINPKGNIYTPKIKEKNFKLSNVNENDKNAKYFAGCINNFYNSTSFSDVYKLLSIKSLNFYNKTGILKMIENVYKENDLYNLLKVTDYFIDDLIFSAKTDYEIDYSSNPKCFGNIYEKINISFKSVNFIINSISYIILLYFNIVFVGIICLVCVFYFMKISKLYNGDNHLTIFRLVIFSNLGFFIFNLSVFFFFKKDIDMLEGKENLDVYAKCFKNNNIRDFLDNISNGLSYYSDVYNNSLKKILVENAITFAFLLMLISPISLFKKIMYFD